MEDVPDLYAEPYDPQRPVVCFDESSTQLLAETREPVPAGPGTPQARGLRVLEGLNPQTVSGQRGWRHVAITKQRTMQDFVLQMRWLVDEAYPDVPVNRMVLDNLDTYRKASLYQTFPAGGGSAHRPAAGVPLHAQTWQLAECGGDGTGGISPQMPEPPDSRSESPGTRDPGMAGPKKSVLDKSELALHH